MSKQLIVYIATLCTLSIILSGYWLNEATLNSATLFYFIILIILAEAYKVPVVVSGSNEHVKISWSLVVSISVLIGCGVLEAIIVNLVGAIVCSVFPKRLPVIKTCYNIGSYVLSAVLSYSAYRMIVHAIPSLKGNQLFELTSLPIFYIVVNFSISVLLMKILSEKSAKTILTDLVGPHYHHFLMFMFIGGIQGYFFRVNGLSSLLLTSIMIGVVLQSFRQTAKSANKRIHELDESNKKSKQLAEELDQTLEQFIHTLTATVDARDPYTYGHSLQVSNYALALATELKLSDQEIETIRVAGLLHDIGKISIPETILFKEGKLTDEEYAIMKEHAIIGEEILSDIPRLSEVATLVGMHHERYNGCGYPRNLKYDEISIGGHILGVSDTLDAILSSRSYKNESTVEEAMQEFDHCRGKQFHPDVVDALFRMRNRLGDQAFKNSASLVDQAVIVGKVKTNRNFMYKVYNKLYSEDSNTNKILTSVK